jgi:hypothetical protein
MSKRRLRSILVTAIAFLCCWFALGVYTIVWVRGDWADLYKSTVTLVLAVPAAILAGSFQRRVSYLQGLRDLWKQMIPAVQLALQYTHSPQPAPRDAFAKCFVELSTAIDSLRSVFKNLPNDTRKGLYPYQNLKDILSIIGWLGYGNWRTRSEREKARTRIVKLWNQMFEAMLVEFDRDEPLIPVSKYLAGGKAYADDLVAVKAYETKDLEGGLGI